MKSALLLALLVVAAFVFAGCKGPDTSNVGKDSTSKAMKQAGGADE